MAIDVTTTSTTPTSQMEQQNDVARALRHRKRIRQAVLNNQKDKSEEDGDEENARNINKISPSVTKKLLISSQHQTSSLLAKFYTGLAIAVCVVFFILYLVISFSEEENLMSVGGIMRALGLWGRNKKHSSAINKAERMKMKIVSAFPPQISYNHDVQELNKKLGLITKENSHVVKAIKRGIILQNMLLGTDYKRRQRRKEKMDVMLNIFDEKQQIAFLRDYGHECMVPSSTIDTYESMVKTPSSHVHHTYIRSLWMWCILYSGYADGYIDHATTLLTEDEWIEHLIMANHGKNVAVVVKDSESLSLIQKRLVKQGADRMNEHFDVGNVDGTNGKFHFVHPSLLILSSSRQHGDSNSVAAKMIKFLLEINVEELGNEQTWSRPFNLERELYEVIVLEQQQHVSNEGKSVGMENGVVTDDDKWLLLEGKCFPTTKNDNLEDIENGNDGKLHHDRLARHCSSSAPGMFGKDYIGFCDIIM